MNALVTGGFGFIGSHLCERLLRDGHHVTVIDDLSTGRLENLAHLSGHLRLRCLIDTIRNKELMETLVAASDTVFHLAAVVGVRSVLQDPLRCLEVNIRGTDMLLELAAKRGVKVLLASSSEIYGKNGSGPVAEGSNRLLGPTTITRWIYSTTKAVDEYLALSYWNSSRLPVVIMRFFNTVGPRQTGRYGMVLPNFVQQALSNRPITVYGDGKQIRTFTHVFDAVNAVVALAEHPQAVGQIFNVGGVEPVSIADLAERVKRLAESQSPIEFLPYAEVYGEGFEDLASRVPDISKLRLLAGYEPAHRLDDMIRDTIAYFRAQQDGRSPIVKVPLALSGTPAGEEDRCRGR